MNELFRIEAHREFDAHNATLDVSCPKCFAMTRNVVRCGDIYAVNGVQYIFEVACLHCGFVGGLEPTNLADAEIPQVDVSKVTSAHLTIAQVSGFKEGFESAPVQTGTFFPDFVFAKPAPPLSNEEINREIHRLAPHELSIPSWPKDWDWCGKETANAVLMEDMPSPTLIKDGQWHFYINHSSDPIAIDADRKRAVALAWLAWKKAQ